MRRRGIPCRAATLLSAALTVSGCAGLGDVAPEAAGLGAGAGAGVLTANPLVGVAVAIGARFATAEGIDWVRSKQRRRVQKTIAATAGDAPLDETVPWVTPPDGMFDALFGTVAGHLQVTREFGGRIHCREVLYTVAGPKGGVEGAADEVQADITGDAPSPPPAVADDWPEAGVEPVLVAAICKDARGWRWAVSQPASGPAL